MRHTYCVSQKKNNYLPKPTKKKKSQTLLYIQSKVQSKITVSLQTTSILLQLSSCFISEEANLPPFIYVATLTPGLSTEMLLLLPLHSTWFCLSPLVRNDTPQQCGSFPPAAEPAALPPPHCAGARCCVGMWHWAVTTCKNCSSQLCHCPHFKHPQRGHSSLALYLSEVEKLLSTHIILIWLFQTNKTNSK